MTPCSLSKRKLKSWEQKGIAEVTHGVWARLKPWPFKAGLKPCILDSQSWFLFPATAFLPNTMGCLSIVV